MLWEINNAIIRAEVITLDNTVDNNFTKHLLEGQSLKLIVPQYHTLTQTFNAGGGEINMNIVKSASKLSNASSLCIVKRNKELDMVNSYQIIMHANVGITFTIQ